jgi:hypothetical protein
MGYGPRGGGGSIMELDMGADGTGVRTGAVADRLAININDIENNFNFIHIADDGTVTRTMNGDNLDMNAGGPRWWYGNMVAGNETGINARQFNGLKAAAVAAGGNVYAVIYSTTVANETKLGVVGTGLIGRILSVTIVVDMRNTFVAPPPAPVLAVALDPFTPLFENVTVAEATDGAWVFDVFDFVNFAQVGGVAPNTNIGRTNIDWSINFTASSAGVVAGDYEIDNGADGGEVLLDAGTPTAGDIIVVEARHVAGGTTQRFEIRIVANPVINLFTVGTGASYILVTGPADLPAGNPVIWVSGNTVNIRTAANAFHQVINAAMAVRVASYDLGDLVAITGGGDVVAKP